MDAFEYREGRLWAEGARVEDIAREFGTPLYVYSRRAFVDRYRELADALAEFDPLICYSVKANGNLSVLRTLAAEGSGFDLVSGGELFRALRAGGEAGRMVFAGVGKTDRELDEALSAGIRLFTVESVPELEALSVRATARGGKAAVALRVNPDVDAHTHAHDTTGTAETKFGIDPDTLDGIFADPDRFGGVVIDGFHVHIGSQITETAPYALALERVAPLYGKYRSERTPLGHLDIGGALWPELDRGGAAREYPHQIGGDAIDHLVNHPVHNAGPASGNFQPGLAPVIIPVAPAVGADVLFHKFACVEEKPLASNADIVF